MKTFKIYLDPSFGNSVEKMDLVQELFGGNIVRKPNHFGYFFRTILESKSDKGEEFEDMRISVESNRFDSEKDLKECLTLLTTKQQQ